MKRFVLLLVVAASGCDAARLPPPAPPPPLTVEIIPVWPPPPPASPPIPAPVATVAAQYQMAATKEVPAVTAPNVTPDYVRAVHQADRIARRALGVLEAQGSRPTLEALTRAREAVRKLSDVLNATF